MTVPILSAEINGAFVATGRKRAVARIGATCVARRGVGRHCFAVDWDACWLDDRPIQCEDDWRALLAANRLADVEGAFVVAWTDSSGTLHLARDGVGGRTLFYAMVDDTLYFAASIKALLDTGCVAKTLRLASVATYLTYAYLPGRETLVEGVYELLPGERVSFDGAGLRREAFWSLPSKAISCADETQLRDELRAELERAVQRTLPASGQPVAVFLSGGLDSSLVVALAAKLHDAPVHTLSVSFGAGYPNELAFSSMVAAHCGTRHQIVALTPTTVLRYLDESIGAMSDPIGDPLTVPNALLFREAAQHAGVVLNGEGGDPCFGGPKNLPMVLAELYAASPMTSRSREASYLSAHLKCYDDLHAMLSADARAALAAAPLEPMLTPMLNDPARPDLVARLQAINIAFKGAHHILPKVDALSAPMGVVPRAPLFDRRVVTLALRLPSRMKLNGSIEKYLLKESVRDLLPRTIIERPKSGMLVPVEAWFRGPLLPAARERILEGIAPRGLFERDYLERLLAGRLGGLRPRHGAKIWLLVTLEAWLRGMGM